MSSLDIDIAKIQARIDIYKRALSRLYELNDLVEDKNKNQERINYVEGQILEHQTNLNNLSTSFNLD